MVGWKTSGRLKTHFQYLRGIKKRQVLLDFLEENRANVSCFNPHTEGCYQMPEIMHSESPAVSEDVLKR